MTSLSALSCNITRVVAEGTTRVHDDIAVEEPLEIRVVAAAREQRVTVTMRTPGADAELAIGFLIAERIVEHAAEVRAVRPCSTQPNLVRVELADHCASRVADIARNFVATSSCGLCGKTSLESVFASIPAALVADEACVDGEVLRRIPSRLRAAQSIFDRTGGLHAVAALTFAGELAALFVASYPRAAPEALPLRLTTVRSHDQYNTTIYGLNDRYRGVYGRRDVVFMHEADMADRELKTGDPVRLIGATRALEGFVAAAYPIARGCCAAYFPEATGLIALEAFDPASRTPAYKSVAVEVSRASAG